MKHGYIIASGNRIVSLKIYDSHDAAIDQAREIARQEDIPTDVLIVNLDPEAHFDAFKSY